MKVNYPNRSSSIFKKLKTLFQIRSGPNQSLLIVVKNVISIFLFLVSFMQHHMEKEDGEKFEIELKNQGTS